MLSWILISESQCKRSDVSFLRSQFAGKERMMRSVFKGTETVQNCGDAVVNATEENSCLLRDLNAVVAVGEGMWEVELCRN